MTEVEEMINRAREEQGRPFDVRQLTTSCVANVTLNMLFGRRFDLSNSTLLQLTSAVNSLAENMSIVLEIFPVLRFFPYFRNTLANFLTADEKMLTFISNNVAACTKVCDNSY